jgi:hypothetical protein
MRKIEVCKEVKILIKTMKYSNLCLTRMKMTTEDIAARIKNRTSPTATPVVPVMRPVFPFAAFMSGGN